MESNQVGAPICESFSDLKVLNKEVEIPSKFYPRRRNLIGEMPVTVLSAVGIEATATVDLYDDSVDIAGYFTKTL